MKIKDYISQKFRAWNITDAHLLDVTLSTDLDLEEIYLPEDEKKVGVAMIHLIEELILAPHLGNVNENGFSVSWDYSKIGQYYMWLCRKYGVAPDDEVVAALGLSTITDKSDIW